MGYFGGMNFLWWILGVIIFIWIFSNPIYKRYQKKQNPVDILKERLAKGEITIEKYQEHKTLLEKDLLK
jgi:putative membrane protein